MASSVVLPLPQDPYEDISWKVKLSTGFSFAIATTALILRLTSRWLSGVSLALTDWLIMLAYVPKLGLDVASLVLVHYGIGRHVQVVPIPHLTQYLKTAYVGSFLYVPCIVFIKLSILALYKSAFPKPNIHKSWTPGVAGRCINLRRYYFGLQIPNIITDFALLFLPLIGLLDMRTALGRSRALQIGAVFALGLVTCVFDIIRFVVMLRFDDSPDITWNNVSASVWTDVEPSMAYLVACLPLLRALVTPLQFWRARGGTRSRAEASEGMSGIELRNRSGPHKKGSAGDISSVRPLSLCQAMRALDSTRLSLVDV
ncbi:MAG: hypothetical protein Q9159_002916 [Coniocarpon cinnabarinum]